MSFILEQTFPVGATNSLQKNNAGAFGASTITDDGTIVSCGTGLNGQVRIDNNADNANVTWANGSTDRFKIRQNGGQLIFTGVATCPLGFSFTNAVQNATTPKFLTFTPVNDTALTAGTEIVYFNYAAHTPQWATGALATQREVVFNAPTYAFVGASTITNAATVAISGAPVAGTNATITNPYALLIQGGNLGTAGKISLYNNIATAGMGVPYVVASSTATGLTGADTNRINYTPPAVAGRYRIGGIVNVTAWTTPASFTVALTYKDDSGNARTDTAFLTRGSTGASAAAVTAVDRWYYEFPCVAINNGATAITVSTTGTFTGSPVYNHSVNVEQLA